ncbi:ABC transporter substrate-binding protein [Gordonia sp. X0973]|uniref:ABC transporter substrate-binding protein n=1 Tax=Gordonia sp. X0973 TaxID=2742602 RepID=UPI000F53424F|nr:ABC transporter substrate-binding protein [Gordonia sp. X0973]QKT07118.1 ABC transporter substrate-binding protein [Gordonia sp. X0973]
MTTRRVVGIAAAAVLMFVGGCTNDESALDTKPITVPVSVQPDIAALVPSSIRDGGVLIVGTNVPYQPNEFKNRNGEIIGYDIDVTRALAQVLGLRVRFVESEFAKIIPAIQAGTFHMGISAFTDTVERQKQVDFVDYFTAGIRWARRTGTDITPETACGHRVSVKAATVQFTEEVPAKSAACVKRGEKPIRMVKFENQDATVNAVLLGQADALSADSPVTEYAVKKTDGQLETVGPTFDSAPYGMPVAKGSALGPALRDALQYLIDHGYYGRISHHWGVAAGMIHTSVINGAKE